MGIDGDRAAWAAQGEVVGMLRRALEWASGWRDAQIDEAVSCALRARDLIALGLVAQAAGVRRVGCTAPALAADLARTLPSRDWLTVEPLDPGAAGEGEPAVVLACPPDLARIDLDRCAAAGTVLLILGEAGLLELPPLALNVRPLAAINPALWCSGLALVGPPGGHGAAPERLAARLGALLGDQSLDPLDLYEEVYRLRGTARSPERADRSDEDLIALRRAVRGLVERAAISGRRAAARGAPTVPVDWAAAFRVPPELEAVGSDAASEAEVRARRARMEAEYLRAHMPARIAVEEGDPHDMLAASGFFDIAWYAETYDVRPAEAIRHYLDVGHREGNDPGPLFCGRDYVEANADVRAHGLNPLVHYLKYGLFEGRPILPKSALTEAIWRDGFGA